MKYSIYTQNQWLYPDSEVCAQPVNAIAFSLLRGQTGGFQLLFNGLAAGAAISWEICGMEGVAAKLYREIPVRVNRNTNNPQNGLHTGGDWEDICRFRTRRAPFYVYDPLEEAEGLAVKAETEAFYLSLIPNADAAPGLRKGTLKVTFGEETAVFSVELTVCAAALPESTLHLTNWFSIPNMARDHGLEVGSPEHWDMVDKYAATMRDCHQDIFRITWENLGVSGTTNAPVFDFSEVKKEAEFFFARGFTTVEWSDVIHRHSWDEAPYLVKDRTPGGGGKNLECLSTGRKYLVAFLRQFNDFLTENGWRENSLMHICDEPKERCADDYRTLAGIYRKYLPGIKLMDAIEICFLQDALDIYVPKNHHFQQTRNDYEDIRDDRNEIWFYTCNMPGGKFLNRFLDSPLLNTRLLHWGNFHYDLTGYLHWGYNHCRPDQDPFEETSGQDILPAGDTHIVYPGKNGPLLSLRHQQMKCGIEDYEMLKKLAETRPELAKAIGRRCFFAFDDYVTDPAEFDKAHEDLVIALNEAL